MVEMRTYLSAPQVALISLTDRATTRSKEYLINDGAIMIVLFKKNLRQRISFSGKCL